MRRPEPSPAAPGVTAVVDDLRELGGAVVAGLARGDLQGLGDLRRRRQALITWIMRPDREAGDARPGSEAAAPRAAAIRSLLALDQRLLAALVACQARTRDELRQLGQARQALSSYRGAGPSSPAYLETEG